MICASSNSLPLAKLTLPGRAPLQTLAPAASAAAKTWLGHGGSTLVDPPKLPLLGDLGTKKYTKSDPLGGYEHHWHLSYQLVIMTYFSGSSFCNILQEVLRLEERRDSRDSIYKTKGML